MESIKEIEKDGLTLKIYPDENAENPADMADYFGTRAFYRRGHLEGGDKEAPKTFEAFQEFFEANKKNLVYLPVYVYEHGGMTISTDGGSYPFNDRWDSGLYGFIYATKDKARKEFGRQYTKKALKCLKAEVEEINSWLTGEVYGYAVEDENGETLDSCWGFYGDIKFCEGEGLSALNYEIKARKDKADKEQLTFKEVMACR